MSSLRFRWTPESIRRVCAATLPSRVQILGESGTEAAFPHAPQFSDAAVSKVFAMRAFAPGDSRLFSAAEDAGVKLFAPGPDSLHTRSGTPGCWRRTPTTR